VARPQIATSVEEDPQVPETAASSRRDNPRLIATDAGLLTRREHDIVCLLLRGDRVPAIARQLWLTRGTVRNHLHSIYRKLGVQSQQELIVLLRGYPHNRVEPDAGLVEFRSGHPLVRRPQAVAAGRYRHAASPAVRRGTSGGADTRR